MNIWNSQVFPPFDRQKVVCSPTYTERYIFYAKKLERESKAERDRYKNFTYTVLFPVTYSYPIPEECRKPYGSKVPADLRKRNGRKLQIIHSAKGINRTSISCYAFPDIINFKFHPGFFHQQFELFHKNRFTQWLLIWFELNIRET